VNKPYVVLNTAGDVIGSYTDREDAVEAAKISAMESGCPRFVYKLVVDVVTETRTEVITYE
jgi:hypothetical protein